MTCVSEATMQRKLNHVLEVKFNFVGCQRIRESIKRLLQLGFEVLQSAQSFVQCCFIHQTTRSVDEQTNIFVKFDIRWKFHRSSTGDPSLMWPLGSRGLSASRVSGTPSHFAASSRSRNIRTLIGESSVIMACNWQ